MSNPERTWPCFTALPRSDALRNDWKAVSQQVTLRPWPRRRALAAEATVTLPVQVNGRRRFTIEVPAAAGEAEIADLLARHPGFPVNDAARLVIVPGKIVNIVLR
jgi:leucyl-tRNA synthetase